MKNNNISIRPAESGKQYERQSDIFFESRKFSTPNYVNSNGNFLLPSIPEFI